MRLVVRTGGSVVASPVNTKLMSEYADLIKTVKSQGHEVAVVIGGGVLAREFIKIAKDLGLDMQAQDEIAISCSRLFAQLFLKSLGEVGCSNMTTSKLSPRRKIKSKTCFMTSITLALDVAKTAGLKKGTSAPN